MPWFLLRLSRRLPSVCTVFMAVSSLLTSVLVSSCSSDTSQVFKLPPHDDDQPSINAHPVKDLKHGGVLNLYDAIFPSNFLLSQVDGSLATNGMLADMLYPSAFYSDAHGELTYRTEYFSDIQLRTDHGRQIVSYTINPHARWDDGTPITWKDLYQNWIALNGKDKGYQPASTTGYNQISSITPGIDDRQAIVSFATPYADWKGLFSPIYEAKSIATPQKFNGWISQTPPGAGPFRVASIDQIAQVITLVRNPLWWGSSPPLDKIILHILDSSAALDAYQNGQIDAVDIEGDPAKLKQALTFTDTDIRRGNMKAWDYLMLNGSPGRITSDMSVRKAIFEAINRSFINKVWMGPLVTDTLPILNNHIFLLNQNGYHNNSNVTYNPQQAAQELSAAGWKLGPEGIRWKNGQSLTIHCVDGPPTLRANTMQQLVQADLKKIGVRYVVDHYPWSQVFTDFLEKGNFDAAIEAWEANSTPVSANRDIYYLNPTDPKQNFPHLGSTKQNELWNKAMTTTDPQQYLHLANQIDSMIWDDANTLPLFQRISAIVTRKNLANYGAFLFGDADWTKVGWLR